MITTVKGSEMKRVSKFLSVMAISAAILAPTAVNAATWGDWVYHSQQKVSRGFNFWVLECHYFRDAQSTGGSTTIGNREWKQVDVRIWDVLKPPQCPAASSI